MFCNARALSGAFSTIVNLTVSDFLHRSQKLSILNQIKHERNNNHNQIKLRFPIHHKHKQDDDLILEQKLNEVFDLEIEKVITNAYDMAIALVKPLNIIPVLKKHNILEMDMLSQYVYSNLKDKSRLFDDTTLTPNDFNNIHDFNWEMDESDGDDYDYSVDDDEDDDDSSDVADPMLHELIDIDDDEPNMTSTRTDFQGINIRDNIDSEDLKSYFKIKINNKTKYLHKQSACWLLTDENAYIFTDRLFRVIQTSDNNM
ncbi:unnamed protein product [Rotaria sp. Silwood2]|nr:unnamed protein product [Rotaria sp. Silwood2]CAF3373787.1 unnamed protein product [Rotaria sp. Silwood2]CAF4103954.1 unnamed protein product [Rotaria sp. Silwood2]CAF4381839.1 unnamed protein product [Rotaria sp. Silwood2]